jgi:hypothetical protein
MTDKPRGYLIALPKKSGDESGYTYIGFHGFALDLTKSNQRNVKCVRCPNMIKIGGGVRLIEYGKNGYLHIECAKYMIHKYGDEGYTENAMLNLQACFRTEGPLSAERVAKALIREGDL